MKTMKKSILLVIVMLAFAASSYAQVTASATSTAVVVTPLTIIRNTNLDFGSIAATGGGTLTINPATSALTPSAGVAIISGTATAAQFTASGSNNEVIQFTFPATITLSDGGGNTMLFTLASDLGATSPVASTLSATGSRIIYIGGVLTVGLNQAPGTYSNAAGLAVSVNYN